MYVLRSFPFTLSCMFLNFVEMLCFNQRATTPTSGIQVARIFEGPRVASMKTREMVTRISGVWSFIEERGSLNWRRVVVYGPWFALRIDCPKMSWERNFTVAVKLNSESYEFIPLKGFWLLVWKLQEKFISRTINNFSHGIIQLIQHY